MGISVSRVQWIYRRAIRKLTRKQRSLLCEMRDCSGLRRGEAKGCRTQRGRGCENNQHHGIGVAQVPHPTEEFASLSALVSMDAELEREDDPAHAVTQLQGRAEDLVDSHLRRVSANIAARVRLERKTANAQAATANKADALAQKHDNRF